MPETSFMIRGSSQNKLRIEATEVTAEGGGTYPRLLFPVHLDFGSPERNQPLILLSAQADLLAGDAPDKLSDSVDAFGQVTVLYSHASAFRMFEFPLDLRRISEMESRRAPDLKIRLQMQFLFAGSASWPINTSEGAQTFQALTGFETTNAVLPLEIPHSHWVEKLLPRLGYGSYFVIDIPMGRHVVNKAWQLVEKADGAFVRWDTKSVFAHCREAGVLLDTTLREKLGATHFAYCERWGRAYKQFTHCASLDLHLEDIKGGSKYDVAQIGIHRPDAEHLLIVTKSLVKYAEELLSAAS